VRRRRQTTRLLLVAVLVVGCGSSSSAATSEPADEPAATERSTSEAPTSEAPTSEAPTSETPDTTTDEPATIIADPERLRIPAIEVDAPVIDLGLTDRGGLEVPSDWDATGWWTGSAAPGHVGATVIAGHVDSRSGPAVFYRLEELTAGDEITVIGADGTEVTYAVDRIEQFPKAEFPTRDIYGPTPEPTLRLVTCGGPFDESWGHYVDNVAVYATATGA
jgi:LPXTG-site transpeptidase (sortase) family protein